MTTKILAAAIAAACAVALTAGAAQAGDGGRSTLAMSLVPELRRAGLLSRTGVRLRARRELPGAAGRSAPAGPASPRSTGAIRSWRSAGRRCARRSRSTSPAAR